MIFSFPGPYSDIETLEGGEHLATDEERIRLFGVPEHIKIFGQDFYDVYTTIPGGFPLNDGISDDMRASISVRPGKAPFHVWQREGGDHWDGRKPDYSPPASDPVPTKPDPKTFNRSRS